MKYLINTIFILIISLKSTFAADKAYFAGG